MYELRIIENKFFIKIVPTGRIWECCMMSALYYLNSEAEVLLKFFDLMYWWMPRIPTTSYLCRVSNVCNILPLAYVSIHNKYVNYNNADLC